jgi:hypothetical protein
MGAVSRSGLKRVLSATLPKSFSDALPCDVLVVKPTRFARRVNREPRGHAPSAAAAADDARLKTRGVDVKFRIVVVDRGSKPAGLSSSAHGFVQHYLPPNPRFPCKH